MLIFPVIYAPISLPLPLFIFIIFFFFFFNKRTTPYFSISNLHRCASIDSKPSGQSATYRRSDEFPWAISTDRLIRFIHRCCEEGMCVHFTRACTCRYVRATRRTRPIPFNYCVRSELSRPLKEINCRRDIHALPVSTGHMTGQASELGSELLDREFFHLPPFDD